MVGIYCRLLVSSREFGIEGRGFENKGRRKVGREGRGVLPLVWGFIFLLRLKTPMWGSGSTNPLGEDFVRF